MIFSQDAETAVIVACLLNPKMIDECSDILQASDFYFPVNRTTWAWMIDQSGKGGEVEVIGLAEHLQTKHDDSEYGGLAGLSEMIVGSPSTQNAKHYAAAVREKSQRRKFQAVLGELDGMVKDVHQDFVTLVDSAQSKVSNLLGNSATQSVAVGEWLGSFIDTIEAKYNGDINPMGTLYNIPDMDRITKGMHETDLVIWAGESGMGKTVGACHIMDVTALRQSKAALMFQLEMPKEMILNRVIGSYAGLKTESLEDPRAHMDDEGWPKLTSAIARLKDAPIIIDDRPGLTMPQMRAAAKRWKHHYGDLGVIIIDHVGIIGVEDKSVGREQQIAEISRQAKIMAKDLKTTVILLAQINRDNKVRKDKRPILSDLRESAALQHNADVVVFTYRDEVYNAETQDHGIAELIVAKNRNGPTGTAKVICDLTRSQFKPITAEAISQFRNEFPLNKVEEDEYGFQL